MGPSLPRLGFHLVRAGESGPLIRLHANQSDFRPFFIVLTLSVPSSRVAPFAFVIGLVFPLIVLGASSCGESAEESRVEQRPGKGGRMYGGVYRLNEVQELRSLDPARLNDAPSHHAVHQIAELLVDFDSNLALQPELATAWDVSEDGLTYTYHIRGGVRFHDNACFPGGKGRVMTAADVKYAFDRILDARAGAFGASYFTDKVRGAREYYEATGAAAQASAGDSAAVRNTSDGTRNTKIAPSSAVPEGGVAGFRVVDDSTFQIELTRPFAAFKYYPALGFCYIYPREAVEHYKENFFRNLVGTGPYALAEWTSGRALVMKRHANYWGRDEFGNQLPFLDGVQFSFIKDEKIQLAEFSEGRLEESYRIPSEFFKKVVTETGALTPEYQKFRLHRIAPLSTQFYGLLVTSKEFADRRVRQAFNYAIDREKIIRYVLQGQAAGPAIHGIVPPSMPGYPIDRVKGYAYDVGKATALMAEAGYPGGKGFPTVTIQLNAGGGRNREVAQAVQEMLSKSLAIKVEVKILEWPQHQEMLENGRSPLFRLGWIADYPDPENFLNLYYGRTVPESGPSPINSTRYRSASFDSLFVLALETQDDQKRMELYAQAEQIAVNDAPMLYIFNDLDYRLVQPWVRDYSSNTMDRRDFRSVWFKYDDSKQTAGL